jgi:hypothetical protein
MPRGGRRKGAGRRRDLKESDREEIAHDYFVRMQLRRIGRDELGWEELPANKTLVIQELIEDWNVSHRMIDRCLAEFLPKIRRQHSLRKRTKR